MSLDPGTQHLVGQSQGQCIGVRYDSYELVVLIAGLEC